MRVLICGGGAVGASLAYFLPRRGIAATAFERTCIAGERAGDDDSRRALA